MEIEKYERKNMKEEKEEIDLYDLVDILVRQKIVIFTIWMIIILGALGGALYVRGNTYDREGVNFKINEDKLEENYYFKKANLVLNTFDYRDMFNREEIVRELYTVPALKELYEKAIPKDKRDLRNMKKFLRENLVINEVREKVDGKEVTRYITAIASLKGNKEGEKELLDKYLTILNFQLELNLKNSIVTQYELVKKEAIYTGEKLRELEDEIKELSEIENNKIKNDSKASIIDIMEFKYPILITKLNDARELYQKYSSEEIGIEGLQKEVNKFNLVERISDLYVVESRSKAKMILAGGIVLGLFLGIFGALMREFYQGYRNSRNKN